MANTKSIIAITITAIAAGAALGILFAPDSGKGTRKKISKKSSDLRDKLASMVKEGKVILKDMKEDAEDIANETKQNVKKAAKDAANGVHAAN